jgi:hypothetical protein
LIASMIAIASSCPGSVSMTYFLDWVVFIYFWVKKIPHK